MKYLFLCLLAIQPLMAFTVVKNVNSGATPEEKVVIFEPGKSIEELSFFDTESSRMSLTPEGALEFRIIGNGPVRCGIEWKTDGKKATFNIADYDYVLITCRIEGSVKITNPNGKVTEQRPDNLWLAAALYDANGERQASANLADATENGRTPDTTTKLLLPMILFEFWGHDTSAIQAVGFEWPAARSNQNRDFRLIVERIALAKRP